MSDSQTPQLPQLYTLREVAEATGLPYRSLDDDARAGRFEHIHYGKYRRMTAAQVKALLLSNTKGTTNVVTGSDIDERLAAVAARVARQQRRRSA
jgi:hypothetical protein